ncbi:restriction endonuclease subunit M, partial [Mycoplasmopsis pullorum]
MKKQSNEPRINKSVCNQLDLYNVEYKLQKEMLNQEIEDALREYESKSGGNGGNRPDAKALITDPISLKKYVILFEFKGYINKLIKLNKDG